MDTKVCVFKEKRATDDLALVRQNIYGCQIRKLVINSCSVSNNLDNFA